MAEKIEFSLDILEIAKFAKAMSHPLGVYILKKLSEMDAFCYSDNLVEEIPLGRSTLSRHLKEFKYAGLIQGETESPFIKSCLNVENWNKAKTMCKSFFNKK
ncbi:MAG: ArsR/SmtB family transcription factor [Candidatus Kapaibacteriales bacterium]